MILHRLIASALREHGTKQQTCFLLVDSIFEWLFKNEVYVDAKSSILDLGCGSECYTAKRMPHLHIQCSDIAVDGFDININDFAKLGQHDLVLCTNVYEHLWNGPRLIADAHKLLKPGGYFYLAWTNWLSPWGGHGFVPFHYLGPKLGPRVAKYFRRFDEVVGKNLFVTHISDVLAAVRQNHDLQLVQRSARYYDELSFIMWLPVVREFLAWNPVLLIKRK